MEKILNKINTVAIYLRKSRDEESVEDVLSKHRFSLTEYAKKQNWKYVEYPEIKSGDKISERPVFQKLLEDIRKNYYDGILIMDIDRLCRGDQEDQGIIKKILSKAGVFIITTQKIYDLADDSDDMFVDLQSFIARVEYKTIIRRFMTGKKIGARQGNWVCGIPSFPYLYDAKRKGLVVDESKRDIYLMIKDWFLNTSLGTSKIGWELNKLGIATPRNGQYWRCGTLTRLLRDETHLGWIIYGKTKGNYKVWDEVIQVPKDEWIVVKNCHEILKTEEEHQHILLKMAKNKRIPDRAKSGVFNLSGLLYCGVCGYRLQFARRKEKNKIYIQCASSAPTGERCNNKGCDEKVVMGMIKEYLLEYSPDDIEIKEKEEKVNLGNILQEKEKELKLCESALNKIHSAYENGVYTDDEFLHRKNERRLEFEKINKEIEELNIKIQEYSHKVELEQIIKAKQELIEMWGFLETKDMNYLLRKIFDRIIYHRADKNQEIVLDFIAN